MRSGKPCPNLVFLAEGGFGYGRFLALDAPSAVTAASLLNSITQEAAIEPLRRTMLWGGLWENVHVAQSAPRGYLHLALQRDSRRGPMESLARIQKAAAWATVLHAYLSDAARKAAAPQVEAAVTDRILRAPTLGLRIVSFRAFTSIAESPAALQRGERPAGQPAHRSGTNPQAARPLESGRPSPGNERPGSPNNLCRRASARP